jgi:hypothetical protein
MIKKIRLKYFTILLPLFFSQILQGCIFEYINQPKSALPGEIIDIEISVQTTTVPEPTAHKGILGIIAPADWTFISADYTSSLGNGSLAESAAWKDSVDLYYPIEQYGENMKWVVLISDQGYSYDSPVTFNVNLKMQAGEVEGCYNLGYLTTKATGGLLGHGSWAPLSFPHAIGIPDSILCSSIYEVRQAHEWDDLLNRTSGWTGADGIYSIPLDESEQPSSSSKHLLLFSDTFIGEVDSTGRRTSSRLINNTLALMQDAQPNESSIEFFWKEDSAGNPKTVFVPETPDADPGDWYWLMDGISINDTIYIFGLRLNSTGGGGAFGFEVNGVTLIKFNLDDENFISNVEQFDTPLFFKNEIENWEIVLGQAIMPMTSVSGSPSADGYIYVYGPKNTAAGKVLVAARVLPPNIENFDSWEYWDGNNWTNNIENSAAITSGISQEFSVTQIGIENFLLVSQSGNSVVVKSGESPVGPFGIFNTIYECPEVLENPNIFVYNAKAHPSLSTDDELLISYNVNSFSFADHFSDAGIYRPRFIYLKMNDSTATSIQDNDLKPGSFFLDQNYPNPFNPSTVINFNIPEKGFVSLIVFDLLGNKVSELISEVLSAGNYSYSFEAAGINGNRLSSGIYFYTLKTGKFNHTKKMIFLK